MKNSALTLSFLSLVFLAACVPTNPPTAGNTGTQPSINNEENAVMMKEEAMMKAGEYEDFTASALPASVLSDGKTKVLYFFASWCPKCKKADQTLTSWYAHGEGLLTVYKINYDTEKSLEQKYGITSQHTFVKVDGQGNMIEKIQGPSDEELKRLLQS